MNFLKALPEGVSLSLLVQPNGRKSEVLGSHGESLKIRIQAPPVEGKANEVVIEFIAEIFGVGRRDVELMRGSQSRQKLVEIHGITYDEAVARIEKFL